MIFVSSPSAPSGIATSATANGTSAEVTLTWNGTEYPCNSGQISYNLKICLDGQGCIQDSTNNETVYTIRSQNSFPVVTWNSYYVSIVGFCAGSVVKQQGLYAPTGPGGESRRFRHSDSEFIWKINDDFSHGAARPSFFRGNS